MVSTTVDYPTVAKRSFLLGVSLFVVGALGSYLSSTYLALPAWEAALLFDVEVLGVAIALIPPLVFGVVLPLLE